MKQTALILAIAALALCAWAQYTLHVNAFDVVTHAPDAPHDSLLDLHAEILFNGLPLDPPAHTPYLFGADGNHPFAPGLYMVHLDGWLNWIPESLEFVDVICDYEVDFLGFPGYDYVYLESFSANPTDENRVLLEWTTNFETGMLGYNILRSPVQDPGGAQVLNPSLIPATNTSEPHSYSFLDEEPPPGETTLFYWLELVTNDSSDIHGPVIVFLQVPNPEGESGSVPPASGFGRVYPNPFRAGGSAKIELSLPGPATLTVCDSRGRAVKTQTLSPGTREAAWDGTDRSGSPCASGIYILRLSTPTSSHAKKVAVIK
ncbi:MAG: T9SS type A sorting domain-containing protein [Candidatus Syntrophosphaera sp.]